MEWRFHMCRRQQRLQLPAADLWRGPYWRSFRLTITKDTVWVILESVIIHRRHSRSKKSNLVMLLKVSIGHSNTASVEKLQGNWCLNKEKIENMVQFVSWSWTTFISHHTTAAIYLLKFMVQISGSSLSRSFKGRLQVLLRPQWSSHGQL